MAHPWDLSPDFRSWADIAIALVAAVMMPALSVWRGQRMGVERPPSLVPLYTATLLRGSAMTAAVLAVWWFYGRDWRALGLDWPVGEAGRIGLALVAVLAAIVAIQVVMLGSATRGRLEKSLRMIESLKIMPRSRPELVGFLAIAVNAGFWEELLYRGFLIWFFTPFLGAIGGAVLATLIFGLGHAYQGAAGIVRTAALGAIFAAGYLLTESLWWLMGIHALIDIFGGVVSWRVRSLARREGLI